MLVGGEGRSKWPCIQPYQKALISTLPVLLSTNEYSSSLPEVPVSVRVAEAEIVPWAWRLAAANPAATARAKRLEMIFVFIGISRLFIIRFGICNVYRRSYKNLHHLEERANKMFQRMFWIVDRAARVAWRGKLRLAMRGRFSQFEVLYE